MMKPLQRPRLAALVLTVLVVLAYVAAASSVARGAGGTLSFTNCSASAANYAFTVDGSGFTPSASIFVTLEDNVYAGFSQFFPATTDAAGSFSLAVTTGASQVLPATATVYYASPTGQPLRPAVAAATLTVDMLGTGCPFAAAGSGGSTGGGTGVWPKGPSTVDDCRTGSGWKQWVGPPYAFKSQGECVSYVQGQQIAVKK